MSLPFKYEVALQLNDGSNHKFSLDEHGWADKEQLKQTTEISLIPIEGSNLPVVAIAVPEGSKPIIKTRVFGSFGAHDTNTDAFRVYAAGYKKGRSQHLLWILPNGAIEMGDSPKYADLLLKLGYVDNV